MPAGSCTFNGTNLKSVHHMQNSRVNWAQQLKGLALLLEAVL